MKFVKETLKADGLLLLVAIIWGFAFVAQRSGMDHIGPFAFNGARFALGALSLLPVLLLQRRRDREKGGATHALPPRQRMLWSAAAGAVLFLAATLQQVGLAWHSTAGNAGFITCLYVVLVPMAAFLMGRTAGPRIWAGARPWPWRGSTSLCIGTGFALAPGDLLEFHRRLLLGRAHPRHRPHRLAHGLPWSFPSAQFHRLFPSSAPSPPRRFMSRMPFPASDPRIVPILYGGILSTCVAYTLQIIGQRKGPTPRMLPSSSRWRPFSPPSEGCCCCTNPSRPRPRRRGACSCSRA